MRRPEAAAVVEEEAFATNSKASMIGQVTSEQKRLARVLAVAIQKYCDIAHNPLEMIDQPVMKILTRRENYSWEELVESVRIRLLSEP